MISDDRDFLFFFCPDTDIDPCARAVFDLVSAADGVTPTGQDFDGFAVLAADRADGGRNLFIRTADVISHNYERYVPLLNEALAQGRMAVVVNWHEGKNAPDRVLTVHSTGDVTSGAFAPSDAGLFRMLVQRLEQCRQESGALDFSTWIEATHWSGVVKGSSVDLIDKYRLPMFDLEIGSTREAWSSPTAQRALARLCISAAPDADDAGAESFLYFGGEHFEETATKLTLMGGCAPLHVLSNHWLVGGDYASKAGSQKLGACFASCAQPPKAVVVHKGLKAPVRDAVANFSYGRGTPVQNHRAYRQRRLAAASGEAA